MSNEPSWPSRRAAAAHNCEPPGRSLDHRSKEVRAVRRLGADPSESARQFQSLLLPEQNDRLPPTSSPHQLLQLSHCLWKCCDFYRPFSNRYHRLSPRNSETARCLAGSSVPHPHFHYELHPAPHCPGSRSYSTCRRADNAFRICQAGGLYSVQSSLWPDSLHLQRNSDAVAPAYDPLKVWPVEHSSATWTSRSR